MLALIMSIIAFDGLIVIFVLSSSGVLRPNIWCLWQYFIVFASDLS